MIGGRWCTLILVFVLLGTVLASAATAATVKLAWDPSVSSDAAGYKIRYGTKLGSYSNTIDAGRATSYHVGGLTAGQTYYFVVQTYSSAGLLSAYSSSVTATPSPITATPSPITVLGLTANRSFPSPPGISITWTAAVAGGATPYQYKFRRYSFSTGWTTVQNYSSSATYTWTPTSAQQGLYALEVWVRSAGSSADYQATGGTGYFAIGSSARRVSPTLGAVDFDGDGRRDVAVFRPLNGTWYALLSSRGFGAAMVRQWGTSTDVPVPGDYDGDGRTDLAVYRPQNGTWHVLLSSSDFTRASSLAYGTSTDIPVPADYDGDGRTDIALYRPATGAWYVLESSSEYRQSFSRSYGVSTDLPLPGDYDGDGRADLAVFRPSTGTWFVLQSSSGFQTAAVHSWGMPGDLPIPADFDGDRRVDPAVYRPSTGMWYVLHSGTGHATVARHSWGNATDSPVPADYDGDGRADVAVFRPSTGAWYIWNNLTLNWGVSSDIPLGGR